MADHSAHTAASSDKSTDESETAGDETAGNGTTSGGAATDGVAERTGGLDASRRDVMRMAAAGAAVGTGFASNLVGSAVAVGIDTPWLERDGNLLRDPEGQQVILRGVNIADPARLARTWRSKGPMDVYDKSINTAESNDGGWHNHILRVPTQPQDISGANNNLQHAHGDDWGPLLPGQFDETDLEAFFSNYMDPIVDAAEEEGLYVMVDYHRHFPIFHQPQNEEDIGEYQCGNESFPNDLGFCGERGVLWNSEAQASQLDGYAEEYAAELDQELQLYWNFVAPRYNDRSHVIYDVYNEPTGPYAGDWGSPTEVPHAGEDAGQDAAYDDQANKDFWDMWVERAQPWIDTVRTHAPDNLITIGSPRWSQLTYWAPTNEFSGENICYTGHVYTHDSLRPLSDSYGTPAAEVPLFFSEFGWAIGGGKDNFSFLDGTTTGAPEGYSTAYGDDFATFIENHPVHPVCWNFDHTWEPAFFVHDQSQDGSWVIQDYEDRPGQWWQQFLYDHRNDDLPSGSGGDTTAPSIPSNLSATDQSSSSITVSWDASTDSGGSGLAHYNVVVDGTQDQEVSAGTTSATISGLASDTSYQIAVSAEDVAGNTSGTTTVTASTDAGGTGDTTAPTAPSNLDVTSTATSSISVGWNASSDTGGSGLDHYAVYLDGTQDHTVAAGTTSTTVSGLSADTDYSIAVSAVDGAGNESSQATVSATTNQETTGDALVVHEFEAGNYPGSNDLGNWADGDSLQNGAGTVSGGALRLEYDDSGWFGSNVNQSVADRPTLHLRVRGDSGGEEDDFLLKVGGASDVLANVTSDAIGTSYSTVSVDLSAMGADLQDPQSVRLNFWQGAAGAIEIDRIAFDGGGTGDSSAPTAPSNLAVASTATTSVGVEWNASSDSGGSGLDSYNVYVDGSLDHSVAAGTTATTVSGLSASTSYTIGVSAVDGAGNESATTTVTATTADESDSTAPSAPANLSVSSTTTSSASVGWDASTDSGGSGLDHYNVSVDDSLDHTVAAGTTSTTVSDLSADTSYSIGVSAVDGAGNESSTTTVSATTQADGGSGDALLVNDYDGSPAWPGQNDLGNWNGGGSLVNGEGAVTDGELVLEYDNAGWAQERIDQDVSAYTDLVFVIRGASGGEGQHFTVGLGGATNTFADIADSAVTTTSSEARIDMQAAGIDRTSPAELQLDFWQGGSGASTIYVEEVRFE